MFKLYAIISFVSESRMNWSILYVFWTSSKQTLKNKTLTTRGTVITYSLASEDSCFDTQLQSIWILFHVGIGGKSKGCQMQNPSPRSKLLPKMTEGSTDSLSVQRYNATCPWNPVLSISFVFSIRRDQLSFLFSCSFICYLMEGLPTWKTRPLCLSSQWHHPSGYTWELVSLK